MDFGIPAEWHFHATAHGKGPRDGIGGNLKRLAARASLQASSKDPILTADALYQWAKKNLVGTLVFFSPKENHSITAQELESRFASADTVPGTQKYHSFVPSAELTLMLRKYSSSLECDVFQKNCEAKKKEKCTYTAISKLFDSIFDVRGETLPLKNHPELQINFYF